MHGAGHYRDAFYSQQDVKLEDIQSNDKYKENMARMNGIKNYIVINACISNLEYIRENIINSILSKLVDISKVDWKECNKKSLHSKKIETIKLANTGLYSTAEICEIVQLHRCTVQNYIRNGIDLGLCNYQNYKNGYMRHPKRGKKIVCLNTNEIFQNITEASIYYNASKVCIGRCVNKTAKYSGELPNGEKLRWEYYNEAKHHNFKKVVNL